MILKAFYIFHKPRVVLFLNQAGVELVHENATTTTLHIPDDSKVEELMGANFRKYKKITTPNGRVFELDYFRKETLNRMLVVIPELEDDRSER